MSKFIYKNKKGEKCFTSAHKRIYEKEKKQLPFIFYNADEIYNYKNKIIVVVENEELCKHYENIIPNAKETMTFTTLLGGVDRKDVHCIYFLQWQDFKNRIVILLGNKNKFKAFKKTLNKITRCIFEADTEI